METVAECRGMHAPDQGRGGPRPAIVPAVVSAVELERAAGWTAMTTSATSSLAWYLPPDGVPDDTDRL
jgi:hypothetical protein